MILIIPGYLNISEDTKDTVFSEAVISASMQNSWALHSIPGAFERISISVQSKPEEFAETNLEIQHDDFLTSSELQFRCLTVGWPASFDKLR